MLKKHFFLLFFLGVTVNYLHGQNDTLVRTPVFSFEKIGDIDYGYRIPALVTSKKGTLLAFAERRVGLHDHARNDVVLRRSFDNGKTWQPIQIVDDAGMKSLNDPCPVILESGRILLCYKEYPYGIHSRNSGWIKVADEGYDGPRNSKYYCRYSDDDGATWSVKVDITKMVRASERIAIGSPGFGIQIKSGKYKGRVILALNEMIKDPNENVTTVNSVAWSDDEGITWQLSNNLPHEGLTGYGNEAQLAELPDGELLFIARNQGGRYRKFSTSKDGGLSWTNMQLQFDLPGVACQGSVLQYNPGEKESILLYANASNKYSRREGSVKISYDNGKTWPISREVTKDFYAYSCLTKMADKKIGLLYETKNYREISFSSFEIDWIKNAPPKERKPYLSIPIIDLDTEKNHQVIVDREKGQYLGHVTTVLLDDKKTMIAVYPKGHGKGAVVMKKSYDGGKTWSQRLPTPKSWETSQEVPTIYPVVDANGKKRLIMFSGHYPVRMAVSENEGKTWSELDSIGSYGGIVVMGALVELKTGKGHYMALFHDDKRHFNENASEVYKKDKEQHASAMFTLYKTISTDGGLSWSFPEAVFQSREIHICEPGIIRSPDGKQLAVLLRENSRRENSQIIFSNDEGKTWTNPKPLPNSLTGDRHTLKYAHDGRLIAVFRDNSSDRKVFSDMVRNLKVSNVDSLAKATGLASPTEGDWVCWVGTYDDLVKGTEGQYRIRLKDNKSGWDCCYPGVELLPDGTFVTTTYGHWDSGESPYILSVRFNLKEMDEKIKNKNDQQ